MANYLKMDKKQQVYGLLQLNRPRFLGHRFGLNLPPIIAHAASLS